MGAVFLREMTSLFSLEMDSIRYLYFSKEDLHSIFVLFVLYPKAVNEHTSLLPLKDLGCLSVLPYNRL